MVKLGFGMFAAQDPGALSLNGAGSLAPGQRRELEVLLLAARPHSRVPIFSPSLTALHQARRSELEHEALWAYLHYPRLPSAPAVARDLEAGQVESALGECYTPRDCRVDGLEGSVFGLYGLTLMPGPYRFHYVKDSQIIVNAEPLEPLDAYLQRHRAALDELFDADAADLDANRRGELSARQQLADAANTAADGRYVMRPVLWCALGALPLALAHFALRAAGNSHLAQSLAEWLMLPVYLGGAYLLLSLLALVFQGFSRAKRRVGIGGEPRVACDEGMICRYPSEDTGHPFQLAINDRALGVRREPTAVVYGLRYRAYHRCNELLGLEPLEGPCGASLAPDSDAGFARVPAHEARVSGS